MENPYKPAEIIDPGTQNLPQSFARLTSKQRRFVLAVLDIGASPGNRTECARQAGYQGTAASLRVTASQLFHNPNIQAAIRDMTMEQAAAFGPMIMDTVAHILQNGKTEAAQLKAAEFLANRIGMHAVTEHHVKTQDTSTTREALEAELRLLCERNPEMKALLPPGAAKLLDIKKNEEIEDAVFVEIQFDDPDKELGL